jgi:hypothetical protein
MAIQSTIYITASDQSRNGKTLLARLLADYLMLDGRDPFLFDTDAPEGPLRSFFPGRTALVDFAAIQGQMKLFDTILAGPGRDYIIDLPLRHVERFLEAEADLSFFSESRKQGFRVFLFYVVDERTQSVRAAKLTRERRGIDLFVPVRNMQVGSAWPEDDGSLTIPALNPGLSAVVNNKRFSFRAFVQGDVQGLPDQQAQVLQAFLYETLSNLNNLEPVYSLGVLKPQRH